MKKTINILLIFVIFLCFSSIVYKYYNYNRDKKIYSQLQDLAPYKQDNNLTINQDSESEHKSISLNEKNLLEINKDYKMWINIENTSVDYPIVQGKDNDFYLKHDFNGNNNISGTIFCAYENNIDIDRNIVIYGHNMKNETMFNNINKYKNKEYFNQNNKIKIIKDGREYMYEVFSVVIENKNELNIKINFINNEDFNNYVNKVIDKSIYKKIENFNKSDKIITLITCSYEFEDARTIVYGKLL